MSHEPQLLVVNLLRSNGSPALTGYYFVDILSQPDFRSGQKHSVTPARQLLPLTGFADLGLDDSVGVANVPPLHVPLGTFQHPTQAAEFHPGQTSESQVSAVAPPLDTEGIALAVPPASPSLMERFEPNPA